MKAGLALLFLLLAAAEIGAPTPADITDVAWLQGCWELVSPNTTIEEQWMAPRGGSMVGVSRTVRADSLTGFEVVVIREDGDRIVYEAHPSGQPTAAFHSIRVSDSTVVFENVEHDFPQRIGYRRTSSDSLIAWIEGEISGEERKLEFPYGRVECAGDPAVPTSIGSH